MFVHVTGIGRQILKFCKDRSGLLLAIKVGHNKPGVYKTSNSFQWISQRKLYRSFRRLGKSDEKMKLKIARREAKETIKWLDLTLTYGDTGLEKLKSHLIDEGQQIRRILSAIIIKLGG